MRSRRVLALLVVVVVGVAVYAGTVLATPPTGVTPTIFGVGRVGPVDTKGKVGDWIAQMKITKPSDIYVLQNRIAPGGSFGWHHHPGPSFVIVKSGTATFYLGADPKCKPHDVHAGSVFVDKGLDVHLVRNLGKVDLVTVVVSFVPARGQRRIDNPRPGNCPF